MYHVLKLNMKCYKLYNCLINANVINFLLNNNVNKIPIVFGQVFFVSHNYVKIL